MSDVAGLKIVVGADVSGAIANVGKLDDTLEGLQKELRALGLAIDHAVDKGQDISKLEDSFQNVKNKIAALKAEMSKPIIVPPVPPIPVPNDTAFLNTITKQRIAFTDLGRVITGQGFSLRSLASNFALLGPGVTIAVAALYGLYELLNKQTDAEKKAAKEAEHLKEVLLNLRSAGEVTQSATGSEAGNLARVQALSAAITDTNKSYAERKHALDELRETNKAYFGDLTLEAASLKTLAGRVSEYSQALIQEAVVKGQVEEISKLTQELLKQVHAENKLKDARDRTQAAFEASKEVPQVSGSTLGVSSLSNNVEANAARVAADAYEKQRDAVLQLRSSIASYNGELNNAITLQLKVKPLTTAPGYKDELKSVIPVLEQIKKIYEEIAKPNKENLHTQFEEAAQALTKDSTVYKLFQARIAEAYRNAVKDPANASAYNDLARAFQAQLAHIQSPNLSSHIQGIVDVKAEDVDKVESQIEKTLGGSKGLQLKVPATFKLSLQDKGYDKEDQAILLKKATEDALRGLKPIEWRPDIQAIINKKAIAEEVLEQLRDTEIKIVAGIAASEFSQIGIALGQALSGGKGGLQNALKGFGNILAEGLIEIGKKMILASTVMKALKSALEKLFSNPLAGIVVGIAAVAAGELLKAEVNKTGSRAFATGGIVTGPTNALIGEAGPEVVFPLQQLNRFVKNTQGSGDRNINVTGYLSGNNIRLALARTNKQQGLV